MFQIEKRTQEYFEYRKPDHRIVDYFLALLNLPKESKIADIGAGYGKYSSYLAQLGFNVIAIEPSVEMADLWKQTDGVKWVSAYADNIPLEDNAVDASILILSVHHFTEFEKSIGEINRITKNKILIMTFDPEVYTNFWMFDYIPELRKYFDCLIKFDVLKKKLMEICGRPAADFVFMVPEDCCDFFFSTAWKRPELYFIEEVRKAMSPFSVANNQSIKRGLMQLENDLNSGAFSKKYNSILEKNELDTGCRFVLV